ncbi:MAG: ImmA/IrrE family metallo-endopeptidase [Planctomycetes bacterium]|nr:ImmA/IrrE family metallo-endopeptidase [Planctomycetota bacterium]
MVEPEHDDPRLLGQRLTAARKARGVTQEEAAKLLGCSRPTLIAIEKGERRAKPDEIMKLAAFYGRSVHELVRPGVKTVALEPHLRAVVDPASAPPEEMNTAIAELERFAEDYCELERLLDAKPVIARPPEVSLPKRGSLADFGEDAATRERERLGLGNQPILNLRQVLEADVGLRVFYGSLPSKIAGMFAYTAELGFCVFINRKHPSERRRATLAHEYGHELLHQGERRHETTKTVRETEAEAVAFVVCQAFGLDSSTRSADYIQLYRGTTDTLAESLDFIQKTAAQVIAQLSVEPDAASVAQEAVHGS